MQHIHTKRSNREQFNHALSLGRLRDFRLQVSTDLVVRFTCQNNIGHWFLCKCHTEAVLGLWCEKKQIKYRIRLDCEMQLRHICERSYSWQRDNQGLRKCADVRTSSARLGDGVVSWKWLSVTSSSNHTATLRPHVRVPSTIHAAYIDALATKNSRHYASLSLKLFTPLRAITARLHTSVLSWQIVWNFF